MIEEKIKEEITRLNDKIEVYEKRKINLPVDNIEYIEKTCKIIAYREVKEKLEIIVNNT